MKFRYKKFGTSAQSTLRPVIPVTLCHGSAKIQYEVLVDSGADLCIFHAEIGEMLGLEIKKGKPSEVFGVGGKASVYYVHPITIEVGGWRHHIEAGFMPSVAGNVMRHGLVGQRGFFDLFSVKFDLRKEEIELKPYAARP